MNSTIDKLRRYIKLNDIDAIKTIIEKEPEGICYTQAYSTEGNWVDHESSYNGNYPEQDPSGNNVLLHAISSSRYEIADLFIDDAQKKLKEQNFLNFINYQYPPVKDKLHYINTALTLAAKHEKYQLVKKLLNLGADPNGFDQHGFTTATILCMQLGLVESKNPEIFSAINLLLEKGADFDQQDNFGFYPYNFIGYELNHDKIVLLRFLFKSPPNLEKNKTYSLQEVIQHIYGHDPNDDTVAEVAKSIIKDIDFKDNYCFVYSTGEHNVDAAIFDSLKWAPHGRQNVPEYEYAVTRKVVSYFEQGGEIRERLQKDRKKVTCKQDFLKSEEGVEMIKLLFDQIVSNKVNDHEVKDSSIILKIMNFDPTSLPVPKDFNERVEIVTDSVDNYKLSLLDRSRNLSDEELIESVQSILKEMQLDSLGSVPVHE